MRVDPVAEFLTKLPQNTRICIVITGAVLIHLSLGTYHTFGKVFQIFTPLLRGIVSRPPIHFLLTGKTPWVTKVFSDCESY